MRKQPQLDLRLFILTLFCLVLTFYSTGSRYSGLEDVQPSEEQYLLDWTNHSFQVRTYIDDTTGSALPARIAPFFFQKFSLNDADSSLLQIIPGIGPELANRIITERNKKGGFTTPDQLLDVPGIGQKRKDKLLEWIKFD